MLIPNLSSESRALTPLPTTAFFFWEQQECQKLNYTIILPEVIRKIRLSQTVIE